MLHDKLCALARVAGLFWDFIDRRDIEKHVVVWAACSVTAQLLFWTENFATSSPRSGTEVATIIAAIWGPWSLVQGAIVNWYFATRVQEKAAR